MPHGVLVSPKPKKRQSSVSSRGRGRPPRVPPELLGSRADYIESSLKQVWNTLGPGLLAAKTVADVAEAFEQGATPYIGQVVSPDWYKLVLTVLNERRFPKTKNAQVGFLAKSVAGWGEISARRSRDITETERKKNRVRNRILRYEFYVECSCGYKGQSMNHACPECKAAIDWRGHLA